MSSDTDRPNRAPYDAIQPEQSLTEPNPANAPLSAASRRMDFSREDRAPQQILNLAIWKSAKGAQSRLPAPRHALHVTETDDR